jgi:hypothetical protein
MRSFVIISFLLILSVGGWWLWTNDSLPVSDTIKQYVQNGELTTLEMRFYSEQIMKSQKDELLGTDKHTYQEPQLKFFPHLLIEAKYTQADKRTREGMILWSLVNGEMVIDADTWEETRGFSDAIQADATRNDFKIMNVLAKNQGRCTEEELQDELHLEAEALSSWISSAAKKRLVLQTGNELQLHLQDPKIFVTPQTKIKAAFVMKPYNHQQCASRKYSRSQIEQIAQAAFGPGFTIKSVKEVYLPVHCIGILNPDGSTKTTYWNAVNGKRILAYQL